MTIRLVGIQKQDYKLESGYEFHGKKLHGIDLSTMPEGQTGNQVINSLKIPDGSALSQIPLEVGKVYTVYFNQKGQLDSIFPQDKAQSGQR